MDPYEISVSVSAVAAKIAMGMDDEELEQTAAIFVQLGETLAAIGVHRAVQEARCSKEKERLSLLEQTAELDLLT